MNNSLRSWPPLIVAERVPRSIKWRDAVLTLCVWGLFAALFAIELGLFVVDLGNASPANGPTHLELLAPFLTTAAILAGLLVVFSFATLQSRRRGLSLPEPAPLQTADQARRAGVDEAALISAREQRIVIVHVDAAGRHRFDVKEGVYPRPMSSLTDSNALPS